MNKGLISIFAMPHEIDDLHITLLNLKRNMAMLPHDITMDIDLTFCASSELTDWDKTTLPIQYFIEKFHALTPLWDWSANPRIHVEHGEEILGCVSQRRKSLDKLSDYDFTIWLDCDMFFGDNTILYLASSYSAMKDAGHTNFIVTPQFVKQWDSSWDSIVHPHFSNSPLMYHEEADIIGDALYEYGEMSLAPVNGFKFAGGWCTLLSNDLLSFIGVPESLGHYGLEDTYITTICDVLQKVNHQSNPRQYMITNLVVGENYRYRTNKHLKNAVHGTGKKEEFRAIATKNFPNEVQQFLKGVII